MEVVSETSTAILISISTAGFAGLIKVWKINGGHDYFCQQALCRNGQNMLEEFDSYAFLVKIVVSLPYSSFGLARIHAEKGLKMKLYPDLRPVNQIFFGRRSTSISVY